MSSMFTSNTYQRGTPAGTGSQGPPGPPGPQGPPGSGIGYDVTSYGAVGDNTTDSTTAINACIAAAKAASAAGGDVYWPPGTYVVSGNLVDFWAVDHYGSGIINNSGTLFRIEPRNYGETNVIYMTATGSSDTNDGLSSARPIATFAQADLIFQRLGQKMMRGNWTLRLSGTFQGGYTFYHLLRTPSPIVFQGDTLVGGNPVTTVNYDGNSIFGLRFEPGGWVSLKNLKFTNFVVGFNGYGALTKGGGDMYVQDCRAENCDCGFSGIDQAVIGVYNSYITGCTTGVRVQYGSTGTVGSSTMPTTITSCDTGMMVSRNAVAHLDYSTITDCTYAGLHVDMAARVAMIDGTMHRNAVGALIEGTAEWTQDADTDWGIGTANANTVNWRHRGAGHENRLHSQETTMEWRMFTASSSYTTSAGVNTLLYALGSSYQFQPGHFSERAEQKIRVKMHGSLVGSASKSISFYKTNTDGTGQLSLGQVSGFTGAGDFAAEIEIWPTGNNSQMYRSALYIEAATPIYQYGTTSIANDVAWMFRLYANSGAVTSTVTVDMFEVFITG